MESSQVYDESSSSSENSKETPQIFLDKSLFSPFLVKTLKVKADVGFSWDSACYNAKNNMIIACPRNQTIQFYDATTFELLKEREVLDIKQPVAHIAFHPGTDTYLLVGESGLIYKYNGSKNQLKELLRWSSQGLGIVFLDSTLYAFTFGYSPSYLCVEDLNDGDNVRKFDLRSQSSNGLCHLSKEKVLFAGLKNGSVRIYRTNKLPDLKAISLAKTVGGWFLTIQCFCVNGKEYVVTANEDKTLKIWHWLKGRMRLLKVLYNEEGELYSLVYLENYRMIATTCQSNSIMFWRFPSMKLASTIYLDDGVLTLFLMKEKNLIGVTNQNEGKIEFIQLHKHL